MHNEDWGFIVLLKAHTHGIFDSRSPETLREVWRLIEKAILKPQSRESMMWSKIPGAKFGFRMRNIFEVEGETAHVV